MPLSGQSRRLRSPGSHATRPSGHSGHRDPSVSHQSGFTTGQTPVLVLVSRRCRRLAYVTQHSPTESHRYPVCTVLAAPTRPDPTTPAPLAAPLASSRLSLAAPVGRHVRCRGIVRPARYPEPCYCTETQPPRHRRALCRPRRMGVPGVPGLSGLCNRPGQA